MSSVALELRGDGVIPNRTDLQHLAEVRIEEARALLAANMSDGAYYLAGYAVELALKACIAQLTQEHEFYDFHLAKNVFTHEPKRLVALANLRPQLDVDMQADAELEKNWVIACQWGPDSRYKTSSSAEASALIEAITDPHHGVLQWIRIHW